MKSSLPQWTVLIFCASSAIFASGCAFSVDKVHVGYRTPREWPRQFEQKPEIGVTIGSFEDKRPVATPGWLANKYNAYGKTSGGYEAEKPLAEILRDAVISGLIEANYRVEKDLERSVLTCNVLDYDAEFIQAGLFGSELRTRLQCEFTLIDNASRRVLWKEIIQGSVLMGFGAGAKAKNQYPWRADEKFGSSGPLTKEALRQITVLSIDKVVMDLVRDEQFRRAVTQ
jgi:hypothetical protein